MNNYSNFKKRGLSIGLSLYLFSVFSLGATTINFLETDLQFAQSISAKEDKLFFIYYSADWCMPCKWMEENTFLDPNLSYYINQDYIAIKANISTATGRVLKEQFDVANLPSILVFSASGKLIDRKNTSIKAVQMLAWLQSLDRPQHHLSQSQSLALNTTAPSLNSPRADLHFQRPSLIPEDSPVGLLSKLEEENQIHQQGIIIASADTYFTPRSAVHYGIKLNERSYSYEVAVREVLLLEKKHNEPIELYPAPDHQLSIIIGRFETTGKAQVFLNYLNRNNMKGELIILK